MFDRIRIRVEIFKERDRYVSFCPELNVSSFGDSPEEAKESLKEAVTLFLEECENMGTLKDVLEESGFEHRTYPRLYLL
ncbi:MAG: type II toxin-antitoxin system HicB family antitoxin [Candidatus Abyssobacteria bacterium SURF_17]|jgi:predicted RNase H-like HicB family nuclease|uniref:Type II toxin-antitoxin system HicB family antitoxin n=1 Tax=Candidatus Abyssobacteria bacterium SURF_17 TaxID=2093361 RepID=A0A419EYB6_9BACT|nr:MAG: type II toxin-antitoxin system HicB family antitoxin [Candidatus Abyssubacteria bacterium SURF_17]